MLNQVNLIGRLTDNPKEFSKPNLKIASFSIAINEKGKNNKEEVNFIDIGCFNKVAETALNYLEKGRLVFIGGKLKQSKYTDKDGKNRSKTSVIANFIQFLDSTKSAPKNENNGAPNTEDLPF